MSSEAGIYTGPWINHSHNFWLGATITLNNRDSAFLIALLTLVVTTAGRSLWRIVSFVVHQLRASDYPHDAIFYQQQAILKNAESPLNAAWKLSRASFTWRKHERTRWWQLWRSRSLFLVLLAVTLAAAFAVASIFSSQVTKAAGTAVLITSPDCGAWYFNTTDSASQQKWSVKQLNESIMAANYANACYRTSNTNCKTSTYAVPEIKWDSNQSTSCPFGDDVCLMTQTAAYQMDTGPLDSHRILGIDAPPSDRISVRKVATCAPLGLSPYTKTENLTMYDGTKDKYLHFFLGPLNNSDTNWTVEYNTHASEVGLGYNLETISTLAQDPNRGIGYWDPISTFTRTDADVSLFFFSANGVRYMYNNTDPMYGATLFQNLSSTQLWFGVFEPNFLVTTIGCTDQYQICNPAKKSPDGDSAWCTSLTGFIPVKNEAAEIGLNSYQSATADIILDPITVVAGSINAAIQGRGAAALQAQNTVYDKFQQYPLPNNQWRIEVNSWFAVSLASFQESLVERAWGPTDVLAMGGSIKRPTDFYGKELCKRQMIRNISGFQNFSLLGVTIILVIGGVLVILGSVIDIVVGLAQKWILRRHFGRLSWVSDGYLQLQRLAYEGVGYGNWVKCADEVPHSRDLGRHAQILGPLDISDVKHPRLVSPTFASTSLMSGSSPDRFDRKEFQQHVYPVGYE